MLSAELRHSPGTALLRTVHLPGMWRVLKRPSRDPMPHCKGVKALATPRGFTKPAPERALLGLMRCRR